MVGTKAEQEGLMSGEDGTDLTRITIDPTLAIFKQRITANRIDSYFPSTFFNEFDGINLPKPILPLCCEGRGDYKNITPETLQFLIKNKAQIDYIDQKWYGWEPLHYAACASNPKNLEVICKNLEERKVNTLTILSENALHVLLQHGKFAQSFNVSCQSGQNVKMSRIINRELDDIVECVKILITARIDVNHTNFWNETPILIAIRRRYFRVVRLLLKRDDIDLDSCKDPVSGKTARELWKRVENIEAVPTSPAIKSDKVLFQLLKSGDVEGFLKYDGGKIDTLVNKRDGDNDENSSCTLLQYCFRRSLIFWYQDKTTYESEFQFRYQDTTGTRVVDVFCQSGMAKCMHHLLENKADVNSSLRKFENRRTLLEAAIIKGFYPVVALILGRREYNSPPAGMIETICASMVELLKQRSKCIDLNNTLSIVLTRLVEWVQSQDISTAAEDNLITLLKDNVRFISQENQLLLLKLPGSLCWTTPIQQKSIWCCRTKINKKSVLEDMDPDVVKTHLDECLEYDGQVKINCRSLLKNNSLRLVYQVHLSCHGLREYLNHPIFKILTMQQWQNLRLQGRWPKLKYFDLNLIFYLCFYVFLNIYILSKFNGTTSTSFTVIGCMFLIVFVAKELLQLVANSRVYLKEISNYVEIFFIIITIIMYSTNDFWVDIAEVLSVLSLNLVLLFLLVNVPACAKYVIILRTIAFYIRYILFYFIQFLAFAICFYILFSKNDQKWYVDFPNKIFETIILFTGNLDYMDTPWKRDSGNGTSGEFIHTFKFKEPFSKFVFIVFVLFFAIILQNLLVGLLVIDMNNLHKDVELTEQVKRASFVVRLETFFDSTCLNRIPLIPKYSRNKDENKITLNDSDWKVLTEAEKQNLNFIVSKKIKKRNALKKIRNQIMSKMNERNCEGLRKEKNKEIVEKLEVIEEVMKNLHEINFSKKNL